MARPHRALLATLCNRVLVHYSPCTLYFSLRLSRSLSLPLFFRLYSCVQPSTMFPWRYVCSVWVITPRRDSRNTRRFPRITEEKPGKFGNYSNPHLPRSSLCNRPTKSSQIKHTAACWTALSINFYGDWSFAGFHPSQNYPNEQYYIFGKH